MGDTQENWVSPKMAQVTTLNTIFSYRQKRMLGDFPGGPVVKTSPPNAGGAGSIPDRGAKIPQAPWQASKK